MAIAGSHILVFPYPAQGHMLSLLDLTHQLAIRGLFITILVTPNNLPTISNLLSAHPTTITALLLPLPPHPSIPHGVENVKDLPADGFQAMMKALGDLHDPLLDWFNNHPTPPVAIISDMFLGWTHHLACHLGIRRYMFSPSGAFALSVIYSLWRYLPKRNDPENENEEISFPKIPNSPKYPWWQLSPLYRTYKEGDPTTEFIKDGLFANMVSWGVVINSFTELERVYIDHLKQEIGHDRVFAVGPLLPPGDKTIERGGPSSNEVLPWLDTCPPQSVVYVCFGSQAVLTNEQMEMVALGLERSQIKFVWSVKEPTVGHVAGKYGRIPSGFEDRVAGRGLVVRGWAPQVAILSHESVGAFLTHCGWNSIMEAVVAEVLMLTWPMSADQYSNATLLHELNVGMKACEGAETVPESGELAELFRKSVSEETRVERERAREFGRAAKEAMGENGSSLKELNRLVANLSLVEE
ncbi:UDP-glycosyltransferase 89B2 [Cynara cardunculus var. scolymus]|uniref:UDP-glucuronosyl/UDP-glucosyltransferase n=1 Tax=Cynara cardunculus var. scolymus TaxID=59895 RepID=A0A103XX48_CYNCS|nr:UDP-glycosyltransferase 89B2 [Cynara cardunculus var. scolymus]KVH98489.1 UDP-glucuronosyl/UDP-glucosyltransferase [Cynara cardunculus var. scolymus]